MRSSKEEDAHAWIRRFARGNLPPVEPVEGGIKRGGGRRRRSEQCGTIESILEQKLNEVKRSAKRRCISYELDDDVAKKMFLDRCHYCGGRGRGKILNGIDRVNNSLGYVEGNVVTACGPHNLMKHTMTHMEFLEQCRKVAIEHPATL